MLLSKTVSTDKCNKLATKIIWISTPNMLHMKNFEYQRLHEQINMNIDIFYDYKYFRQNVISAGKASSSLVLNKLTIFQCVLYGEV